MWLAGVSSLEGAERRAGKELWEWWLDALSFRPDSAGRLHIRQTLKHPDVQRKIEALFEALDVESRAHLDADAVVRFSEGIQGTVRVLLDQREPRCVITIPPATAAEHDFLVMNFPILFPPEPPLDLRVPSLAPALACLAADSPAHVQPQLPVTPVAEPPLMQ